MQVCDCSRIEMYEIYSLVKIRDRRRFFEIEVTFQEHINVPCICTCVCTLPKLPSFGSIPELTTFGKIGFITKKV